MDESHPHDVTGAFLARHAPGLAWLPPIVRKKLTPTLLWGAIVGLAAAIGYVADAQHHLNQHQESITELQASRQQDRELLQKIDTDIAVMNSKIGDIATEVDRQREWRERIESVAEETPHARRHK